jgi:phage gp16-like protein
MVDTQRRADLAKIHLAKRELRLDEPSYRALLRAVTGVDSAAGLDASARHKLLAHLRTLGFVARRTPVLASPGQCRKIRWLWLDLHRRGLVRDSGPKALDRYVQRMTGVPVLKRLPSAPASKIIETLKQWRQRAGNGDSRNPSNTQGD